MCFKLQIPTLSPSHFPFAISLLKNYLSFNFSLSGFLLSVSPWCHLHITVNLWLYLDSGLLFVCFGKIICAVKCFYP